MIPFLQMRNRGSEKSRRWVVLAFLRSPPFVAVWDLLPVHIPHCLLALWPPSSSLSCPVPKGHLELRAQTARIASRCLLLRKSHFFCGQTWLQNRHIDWILNLWSSERLGAPWTLPGFSRSRRVDGQYNRVSHSENTKASLQSGELGCGAQGIHMAFHVPRYFTQCQRICTYWGWENCIHILRDFMCLLVFLVGFSDDSNV